MQTFRTFDDLSADEILRSQASKSAKMRALFKKGYTRKEVAEIIGCGYGFVQNVWARTYPERVKPRWATGSRWNQVKRHFGRDYRWRWEDSQEGEILKPKELMAAAHAMAKGQVKVGEYLNPPIFTGQETYRKRLAASLRFLKEIEAEARVADAD